MDARTICLGVLTRGEATGYQIKKTLEEDFGYFLEIGHSAIYPALAELHRDHQVTCTEVAQDGRPDKKVYRVSERGREAFLAGLRRSPGRHRVRSEFVALLLFADFLPLWRIRELLDEREAEFRRMRDLCCAEDLDAAAGSRFAAGLGACMLSAGIDYITANRDWLEASLAEDAAATGSEA